ncbi:MAG: hypothetical protein HZA18_01405 [Nitrospirae bacterium]|nr:hypothetical protein [Nitrospirota bacterium]
MKELAADFRRLKKGFPGYENRPQQVEMAEEVLNCLRDKQRLLIEAGTGVGKSFAYLIPAILSEEKTIISTATIALQDQLVSKDLVVLKKLLSHDFTFALLKGKNNYLCLKREKEYIEAGESYNRFTDWVSTTETGDKDELPFIPDFWSRICGDSDDCSGRECPFYNDCFYYRHYRALSDTDILVVNHHLLLYDLLSEGKILPFHDQLIIDEAHQLENVISHVFGTALTRSRVLWLLYRLKGLKMAVEHLFDPMESFFKGRRLSQGIETQTQAIYPIPGSAISGLEELKRLLALDKVISRLNAEKGAILNAEARDRMETTITSIKSLVRDMEDLIEQGDKQRVYYLGWNRGYLEIRSNMVESLTPFEGLLRSYESMVLTSATLTAGGDFSYLKERLGIAGFREKVIGSPFDYKKQALLYIDRELPSPDKENNESFQQESLKTIEGLVNASRGRALILFTSYQHLNFAARNIRIDYPFKAQGDMPPARLIEWFRETPDSVLLATATFWQGVDIKGEKLSLVVIVKMPFGSPGDPVYDERCRRLKERWFSDLALPSAILLLRQGIGRLIRGTDDRGVVAILDSRLVTSSYGRTIIASLPEMEIVHAVDAVQRFFENA